MSDSRFQNARDWETMLPTMEMVINSLPNQTTGFSPLYYEHEPVTPIQLLKGDKKASTEIVTSFVGRVTSDWELARKNLLRSLSLQQNIMIIDTEIYIIR